MLEQPNLLAMSPTCSLVHIFTCPTDSFGLPSALGLRIACGWQAVIDVLFIFHVVMSFPLHAHGLSSFVAWGIDIDWLMMKSKHS